MDQPEQERDDFTDALRELGHEVAEAEHDPSLIPLVAEKIQRLTVALDEATAETIAATQAFDEVQTLERWLRARSERT